MHNMVNKKKFWLLGDTYTFLLTGQETEGRYTILEISSPPGGGTPLHKHSGETEGFYVVDGEFSFQYGDNNISAKPGTFLHLKKEISHRYTNIGSTTGRMLLTISPSGFENFFAETGIEITDEGTSSPEMTKMDIHRIIKIAEESYDLKILE